MLTGFTTKALILLPDYEMYLDRSKVYQDKVKRATDNIVLFLRANNIIAQCLTTDEVAQVQLPDGITWVNTLNPGDTYFVTKNCDVPAGIFEKATADADAWVGAVNKYPIGKGLSAEQRLDIILKRVSMTSRHIITQQKLLIYFKQKRYNIKPKESSNKLLIEIDSYNFMAKCFMGNMEIDTLDILGFDSAQMPVYEWRT